MSELECESEPTLYIIHENDAWLDPLRAALHTLGVPFVEWHLGRGAAIDLSSEPPTGVFYNRMSASAHTRGHAAAPHAARAVLAWLEQHDRVVVNGLRALELELSKVRQHSALRRAGLLTPRTMTVISDPSELGERAAATAINHFAPNTPFLVKPDCGGK